MTLSAGTRLGSYEVQAPIGAGGMGEVWRARDTKLKRDVAVKVLPASLAHDADALARFEREANSVAALNHPNILSIYDFGSQDGVAFAVMELLEGETLRAAIHAGGLPFRRAAEVARQIATGLAAAHERGIVHRDLKPENVFLTRDGHVKILDFGLAKPKVMATESNSPTVPAGYTQPGTVLGTVGYMSPEQVRGDAADPRSDIFSFGAVLFEILTGKRAFQGETAAETMTAILRDDPPELSEGGRNIPASLERIVRRCLEKKADQRFQSARDVAFALEDLSGSSFGAAASTARASRPRSAAFTALLGAAFGLLAGAAATLWLRAAPEQDPVRVRTLTFSGRDAEPSASPDGQLVAFTSWRDGASRIWVKQLVGGGEAPLTSGPDHRPRFSPDGSSLLFLRDLGPTQAIYRVGLVGGEPRKLVDDATEADWSPDGRRIVFTRVHESAVADSALAVFDVQTGKETILTHLRDVELFCPRWSPDGRTIAFVSGHRNRNSATWQLLQADPAGGSVGPMRGIGPSKALGGLSWSGDGRELLFIEAGSVMGDISGAGSRVFRYDTRTGKRRTLLWGEGLATVNGTQGGVSYTDILDRGRLVLGQSVRRQNLREVTLGAPGELPAGRLLTEGSSLDRQPVYASDGAHVLFSSNRSGNLDLWLLDRGNGALRQVTDDAAQDWDPGFTPDGKQLLWSCDRGGHLEIWTANADGSGAQQLTHDGTDAENPTATRDGRWVVYWSGNPAKPGVWRIHPDGSGAERIVPGNSVSTEVSPDGRYALHVVQARANLRNTIHVVEVESGKDVPFSIVVPYVLAGPGVIWGRARWSPDGRSIYFVGQDAAGLSGIFVQDFVPGRDTSASRRPVAGFSPEYVTESLGLSPDGTRLTISTAQEFATIVVAEGTPGAVPRARKAP